MTASPTERSLQYARKQGWLAQKVEWHNPWAGAVVPFGRIPYTAACPMCGNVKRTGLKHDLFGFVDVLAILPPMAVCGAVQGCTLGIQATSQANAAARLRKIQEERWEAAEMLLEAGWQLEVWAWGQYATKKKDGTRGKRKAWKVRRVQITSQEQSWPMEPVA